jgi:integrase
MALLHVTKETSFSLARQTWVLKDSTGVEIAIFSEFCRKTLGLAFGTRSRYATVVARFIDYLYEVRILGGEPVSRATVNRALDSYIDLLRDGQNISLTGSGRLTYGAPPEDVRREKLLSTVALRLHITPLATNSWANTLAALNRFLNLCVVLEHEAREIAMIKGGVSKDTIMYSMIDHRILWEAVDGVRSLSYQEIHYIKTTSVLGGVIRFRGDELTRPTGLKKSSRQASQMDVDSLDFPEEYFDVLIQNTYSWRDKARWALMIGGGLRQSEGVNLLWCDIDFKNLEVYVFNPHIRVYGRVVPIKEQKLRFKGRTVSRTYIREPYKSQFFDYIQKYREEEYRLPPDGNDFVFQQLPNRYFGIPLLEAGPRTLNDLFTKAVIRAGIPGPPVNRNYTWTSHSLRHAYGSFMTNVVGLTEAELQTLMGHKSSRTSRKYQNTKFSEIKEKILQYDLRHISRADDSGFLAIDLKTENERK